MKDWLRKNAIALASAVIALAALGLSIYTAWLDRDYLRRSHRPQMGGSFWFNENGSGYEFGNLGVGPAYLKWFQAEVDGKPQGSWGEMINALQLSDGKETPDVTVSMAEFMRWNNPRNIYASGQTYIHLTVIPSKPEPLFRAQAEKRVNLRACYCSIFDECWEVGSLTNVPKPVKSCLPYPSVYFSAQQPAE